MIRITAIILLSGLMNYRSFSQSGVYSNVDSIMRNYDEKIRSADELYKVVYFIRNKFTEDSMRLRASFIWITENIDYDVNAFQKEDPRASMLDYVIKNRKAVCGGYAGLLKFFCDAFNIESVIIYGNARTGKRDVNISQSKLRTNHAWNAVKINGKWRLIDPTWAAGSVDDSDEDNLKYHKDFKETYYFTPPEKMIFNHFPDQYQYQYLDKAIPVTKFKKWPLFTTLFISDSISEIHPDTALIRAKIGDTIHFRIKTPIYSSPICFGAENIQKTVHSGAVKKDGDWLLVDYPVRVRGNYNIYIGYCIPGYGFPSVAVYRFEVN